MSELTLAPPLLLDAAGVASALRISKRHLATLSSSGRIPRPIRMGRAVRWNADEIRRWIEAGGPSRDKWEAIRQHD